MARAKLGMKDGNDPGEREKLMWKRRDNCRSEVSERRRGRELALE